MKKLVKKLLKEVNLQVKPYPDKDLKRRLQIIQHCKIDTLLDVGANAGQYSATMRELGYNKKIVSFEPLKSAFKGLEQSSSRDTNWFIHNYALGNEDCKSVINIANNSYSSSLLNMLPTHLESAPTSQYVAQQDIEVKKLDSIFDTVAQAGDNIMLKIDTQGYEKNVLDGAENSLQHIKIIQLEMSIVPLYENELLFTDMIRFIESKGFGLYSLENGFSNPVTGQLLQVDGIFVRKGIVHE